MTRNAMKKLKMPGLLLCCLLLMQAATYARISKPKRAYVEFIVTADHADRIYLPGEQPRIKVQAYAGGIPLDGIWLHYSAGNEMMPAEHTDSVEFDDGTAEFPAGTMDVPGFRTCKLRFQVKGKEYADMIKVGFSPERIRPVTEMPDDFGKFWKRMLAESSSTPANPTVTRLPHRDTEHAEVSLVKLDCGPEGRCVYGYLSKPKMKGKYPVIFSPPGAGSKRIEPMTDMAERGFVTLNIEIHGLSPEWTDSVYEERRKQTDNYMYSGLRSPETFYYKDVFVGCVRSVDFLCSLPEYDGKNVAVTGGSQGGALTIVTAALNPKVTCIAAFYPAMSDMSGFLHGRAGGWPKFFQKKRPMETDTETAVRTLAYYDVANFAQMLEIPGFYSYGYNDETCSPTSVAAALNAVKAPKTIAVTPTSGHWRFVETHLESIAWIKGMLK